MNLDLFPLSAAINSSGFLEIAGHDLSCLVKNYGTPLYLYDAVTVDHQIDNLRTLLRKFYPGSSNICYAGKAYLSLGMARHLASIDIGLDTSSLGEMKIGLKAGFTPSQIHLHGNNKTEEELRFAIQNNIHSIVVDNLDELVLLETLAEEMQTRVRIWLRINPEINVDTHSFVKTAHKGSKFGLLISNGQASKAIKESINSPWIELTGLHTHLGSQLFDPLPFHNAIKILLDLAQEQSMIPLEICPGGGWGVPYIESMPTDDPMPWIETICSTLSEECKRRNIPLPRLIIEPGRWIIARAGVAIYTIGTKKPSTDGRVLISIDGGMADNPRPTIYQSQYSASVVNQNNIQPVHWTTVVGKYCESGDVLIPEILLPEVKRGDLLAIPVSGAYQLSMASNYNLAARPAVIRLEQGHYEVLQPRDDPTESRWWTFEG